MTIHEIRLSNAAKNAASDLYWGKIETAAVAIVWVLAFVAAAALV